MYNLGDDHELDQMSREAAGGYDSPGKANWQALSNELDKVMPLEKKKRRFLFWWLLPVLLAGTGIFYTLYQQNNHAANLPATVLPAGNTTVKPSAPATIAETSTTNSSEPIQNKTEILTPEKTTKVIVSKENNPTYPNQKTKETKTIAASGNKNNPSSDNQTNASIKPETAATIVNKNEDDQQFKSVESKETVMMVSPEKPATSVQKEDTPIIPEKTSPVVEPSKNKEDASLEKIASTKANPAMSKRGRGLSLSVLTGIDKSTVKFTYDEKPGFNIGALAGYHFNDKWALKTGVIYTKKNYKLVGEDFTAPKGTPISYYKLDMVEGNCKMWELPLLVSYTLVSNGKKSVSLNTGLSTYFMKGEEYNYYYHYNGSPWVKWAEYNTGENYVLSILHLSAGFENRLSKHASLLIEPYAKLPLGGVGFGTIKLSSFGVNFSVQYRQPGKK